VVILLFIKSPGKVVLTAGADEGIFDRIHEGISYVFKNQVLLSAFALDCFVCRMEITHLKNPCIKKRD
jgi:hypothetical protein